jgi:hypothetical protein
VEKAQRLQKQRERMTNTMYLLVAHNQLKLYHITMTIHTSHATMKARMKTTRTIHITAQKESIAKKNTVITNIHQLARRSPEFKKILFIVLSERN